MLVEPASLDFGDVALGREQRKSLLVRNEGVAALTVSELRVAGSAVFAVSGLPATLRPGAAARVEVVFQPSAVGSHAGQLKLIADAPGAPSADVDLRGHGVRGLANLSGDVVDFGDVVVNEVATQTFLLVNNDGHAVTSVTIEQPGGADATAFLCGRSGTLPLGPDESMSVTIEFTPSRLGPFQATVQVTPCPTCASRTLSLLGRGVEKLIDVQPPSIDFGEVMIGAEATRPFSIANTSRKSVTVTSVELSAQTDLSILFDNASVPLTLAPGQSVAGTAKFTPRKTGRQALQLTRPASDGGPGALSLTGLGVGPVLTRRPHSFYIGPTALGTTRTGTVQAMNIGLDPQQRAPLWISSISIESQDAAWALTSAPSANVGGPGSSVTVSFSFTPQQVGPSKATLVLVSNDAMHPRVEVPLAADARDLLPCTVALGPGSPVDFGPVQVTHPTTQGFELTNTTAGDCIVGDPEMISGGPAFHWPGGITPAGRTLPPGGRMSIRIEFTPQAAQIFTGAVRFYLSNRSAPSLTVDLTGEGSTSCFFVSPGAVDFGVLTQGCRAPDQAAYAVNWCPQTVRITDVHTSGPPFSFLGSVPIDVAPNTSAKLTVGYQAASPGDDVGSLYVIASSPGVTYRGQSGLTGGSLATTPVTNQWDQSTPKVDLLMVIDNSGSMAEEQQALAANLDHLWNRIALAKADFHLAITITGMDPYTGGWTQCPGGANGGEGGRFFPVDASRPRILTPETPNVRDALFANTNVGLCHWDERFLDPVVAALTNPLVNSTKAPGTPFPADGNAGFLRDDARLALLAVSDADDDNDVAVPPPVADYVRKLAAVKHGALDLVSFAGIVPLHPCTTVEQYPVPRYLEMARQLNGKLFDICDLNNFGALLDGALGDLLLPLTSFPLSSRPMDPAGIAVTVSGASVTTWSYDASSNRIVFPKDAVPPPGSHISAQYAAGCN